MRAVLIRHAQSIANRDARLSSAAPGPALTELGEKQARERAESLDGLAVAVVYTSPILRARATAAVMADRAGAKLVVLDDLREFDLGDWEGREGTDQDILDHPVFSAWLHGHGLEDRFQGGESAQELRMRLRQALDRAYREHPGETVVMVTHGGLLAVGLPLVADIGDGAWHGIPANCEGYVVRSVDQAGRREGARQPALTTNFVLEG